VVGDPLQGGERLVPDHPRALLRGDPRTNCSRRRELDGANPFQVFFMVVLPLARPALATIALFYLVFHWNEFFRAMIYLTDQTSGRCRWCCGSSWSRATSSPSSARRTRQPTISAWRRSTCARSRPGMILLTIVPILAIYPLILKYFTKGTMSGALKG
jgi:putative aldouronate transport system permease protein